MLQFAKLVIPGSIYIGTSTDKQPDALISTNKIIDGKIIMVAVNNDAATVKEYHQRYSGKRKDSVH